MNPEHYIDGFLAAVPTAQREAYRQHAGDQVPGADPISAD